MQWWQHPEVSDLFDAFFAGPDAPVRINGLLLGCQAWSFNRYTAFEAIEKTAQVGGKTIEFFPGQRLSPQQADIRVSPEMPEAALTGLTDKLAQHNLRAVAFGVTGLSKDEAECRKVFAFARKLGILVINSEPATDAFDTIEKCIKEYDIRVGIHNHPKNPGNPNYRYWDPVYVRDILKNRDLRFGACADTGHWVRSGIKPTDALKILKGRIVSSHLKDLHEFSPGGHDVPFGTGVSNIPGILQEMRNQKFAGPLSIEYEYNWDASVPDIAQCVGFVRGVSVTQGK